jgi:hypothetical protein
MMPTHAARHAPREADAAAVGRQHQTLRFGHHRRRTAQDVAHHVNFETRLGIDAAGLAHDPVSELFLICLEQRCRAIQHLSALLIGCGGPTGLRRLGFAGGAPHVLGAGLSHPRQDRAGGRLQDIEPATHGAAPCGAKDALAPCRLDEEFRHRRIHETFLRADY